MARSREERRARRRGALGRAARLERLLQLLRRRAVVLREEVGLHGLDRGLGGSLGSRVGRGHAREGGGGQGDEEDEDCGRTVTASYTVAFARSLLGILQGNRLKRPATALASGSPGPASRATVPASGSPGPASRATTPASGSPGPAFGGRRSPGRVCPAPASRATTPAAIARPAPLAGPGLPGIARPRLAGLDPRFGIARPRLAGLDPRFGIARPRLAGLDPRFGIGRPRLAGRDLSPGIALPFGRPRPPPSGSPGPQSRVLAPAFGAVGPASTEARTRRGPQAADGLAGGGRAREGERRQRDHRRQENRSHVALHTPVRAPRWPRGFLQSHISREDVRRAVGGDRADAPMDARPSARMASCVPRELRRAAIAPGRRRVRGARSLLGHLVLREPCVAREPCRADCRSPPTSAYYVFGERVPATPMLGGSSCSSMRPRAPSAAGPG